MYIFHTK